MLFINKKHYLVIKLKQYADLRTTLFYALQITVNTEHKFISFMYVLCVFFLVRLRIEFER